LPTDDVQRNKKSTIEGQFFQYAVEEVGDCPEPIPYRDYIYNGGLGEYFKEPSEGVRGIWRLDQLPYADQIVWVKDPMHTCANVVAGCLRAIRPSTGFSIKNRSETEGVRRECMKAKIFPHLHIKKGKTLTKPRWIVTQAEMKAVNRRLIQSQAPPQLQTPFIHLGGASSHDSIVFATKYARRAFKDISKDYRSVINNMLYLYDLIRDLSQFRFPRDEIQDIYNILIWTLCDREGLLPPPESTYIFHELVHVVMQIKQLGPPMMNSMWKYERKNKWLKGLIKNKRAPIPSLIKNYLISESCSFLVGTDRDAYNKMTALFQYATPGMRSNLSKTMKTIKRLRFDPIAKIISYDPKDSDEDDSREDYFDDCNDNTLIDFLWTEGRSTLNEKRDM
jgi:hypothetical protein